MRELIEELKQMDPERVVAMSRDSEGNSFALVAEVATAAYKDGDIGLEELTPEEIKEGYSESDVLEGGEKAVVLWPE